MTRLDSLYVQQRYLKRDLRGLSPKISVYEKVSKQLIELATEIEKEKAKQA